MLVSDDNSLDFLTLFICLIFRSIRYPRRDHADKHATLKLLNLIFNLFLNKFTFTIDKSIITIIL